jgi:hypothetical protein
MKVIIEVEGNEISDVLEAILEIKHKALVKPPVSKARSVSRSPRNVPADVPTLKSKAYDLLDNNNSLTAADLSNMVKGLSKKSAGTYLSLYRKKSGARAKSKSN